MDLDERFEPPSIGDFGDEEYGDKLIEYFERSNQAGIWRQHDTSRERYEEYVEDFLNRFNGDLSDPFYILDVGSSTGTALDYFAGRLEEEKNVNTVSISLDINRAVLGENRENGYSDRYVTGKAQELPFREDCFDYVICNGLIGYLPREDQVETLKEVSRVLKEDGKAGLAVKADHKNTFTQKEIREVTELLRENQEKCSEQAVKRFHEFEKELEF
ncbi:MAG: class I SAM-dependent methyltransferase [Candidatus Nanohaloarchaeota archaeon QJJ-9]|nr:class I SAM-dependent methyltransferase [Candidatus Nanohaloarchaeota archaeon QJJ-9]